MATDNFLCMYVMLILIDPVVLVLGLVLVVRKEIITYCVSGTMLGSAIFYNPDMFTMRWLLFCFTDEKCNPLRSSELGHIYEFASIRDRIPTR